MWAWGVLTGHGAVVIDEGIEVAKGREEGGPQGGGAEDGGVAEASDGVGAGDRAIQVGLRSTVGVDVDNGGSGGRKGSGEAGKDRKSVGEVHCECRECCFERV